MNNAMEILTVEDLAKWLRMSKGQVYEMTKTRTRSGVMKQHPLPFVKINSNVRFIRTDVEVWLRKLTSTEQPKQSPQRREPR
jgi:predicted DNA-binding transcriptional regulator AlpA